LEESSVGTPDKWHTHLGVVLLVLLQQVHAQLGQVDEVFELLGRRYLHVAAKVFCWVIGVIFWGLVFGFILKKMLNKDEWGWSWFSYDIEVSSMIFVMTDENWCWFNCF
jgi:hypothetical protein